MKLLVDFLPIVIFFIVYKMTGDLILATAVLIPATMLQMGYTWLTTKKVEKMQLVTLILVVVLGGDCGGESGGGENRVGFDLRARARV